jgi:hypothetical protein
MNEINFQSFQKLPPFVKKSTRLHSATPEGWTVRGRATITHDRACGMSLSHGIAAEEPVESR